MQSFKDVWDRALMILKNDLNNTSFETWILLLTPMKMENDTAYFCVSTLFQKNILEQRYKDKIENALSSVMGFPVAVNILFGDEVPPRFDNEAQKKTNEVEKLITRIEEEEEMQVHKATLTFENFVMGKENQFACATAMAIANNPGGTDYNPYFLYGHSGLGKTHLINAIANKIRENNPNVNILCVKADEFTSELIDAIQFNTQRKFKEKYRKADVLMVDDVQFISGKKAVQEEFFHTFDALYENNRQIILTSDRPPKELVTLEERLQSRFSMGWLVDIQPPEYETRVAIIKKKASLYNLVIPEEVVDLIAQKIKTNVRELEGTIKKLKAYNSLYGKTPTLTSAKEAMEAVIRENTNSVITPANVIEHVARYYKFAPDVLTGKKQIRDIVFPRQVAMYIIREITNLSLPEIGREIGGKNHTTVLYSIRKVEKAMQTDPKVAKIVAELIENIKKSY